MLKLNGGFTSPTPTPNLKFRLSEGGRMYKIRNMVYKIVQNEYKIMIQFFMLKLNERMHVSHHHPKI